MYVSINPYNPCPCSSGQKAKFCCLNGKKWDKKPTLLTGKTLLVNHSHVRCYANGLNDCSDKISKEHYISEYLLNNLGNANTVNIKGLFWQGYGNVQTMPKATLASNILCTRHNKFLSPFDSEMGRFHRTIVEYNQNFELNQPVNEFSLFCGEDLEKWLLKTVCAFIMSKQIGVGDKKVECQMKDIYTEILFKNRPFPEGWGLYVDAASDQTILYHNYLGFNFLVQDESVLYVKMILTGLTFYLVLDTPNNIKQGMIYRPRGIEIKRNNVRKTLEICWQDKKYKQGVFLTHQKDITKTKDEWNDFVFSRP